MKFSIHPLAVQQIQQKIISEMSGIPCREEPRLIEQNFGKWESTPRDGKEFKMAKASFACRYEGGESMLQLAQRIYNLLDEIKQESDHKTYISGGTQWNFKDDSVVFYGYDQ